MKKKLVTLLFFLNFTATLSAQTVNEQIWLEYMLNYPFANNFNLENALTYSTLMGTPKWRAFDYAGTVEWSINNYVDVMGQFLVSYTKQTNNTYNTLELRPALGTRLYFTPNKRVQTRLLARLEQRNFKNLETGDWNTVIRPRLRAEVIVPINKTRYYADKLWYGITDLEALFTTDDVEERFANRLRFRAGLGYRFSYNLRVEFVYMLQFSRNTIDDNFDTNDNIFRFRVKQYLRKSKPSKPSGPDN